MTITAIKRSILNLPFLNSTNRERNFYVFITIFSAIISLAGFIYYYQQENITLMIDGITRLNTARRVLYSQTPGIGQLGGIWLPLPSILMIPTIWSDFMYYSGLSGSIISMIFYVISGVALSAIVFKITRNYISAFVSSLVYLTNPSMVYFQSTPMTESMTISLIIISTYFLLMWSYKQKGQIYLIIPAFFALLINLTRYEGWVFTLTAIMFVGIVSWLKSRNWGKTEGNLVIFSTLALFGVFLWLIYNLALFGDPFNFAHEIGSTASFVKKYIEIGGDIPTGDIMGAVRLYFMNSEQLVGLISLTLSVFGLLLYIKHKITSKEILIPFLLSSPFLFHIYALFTGQTFFVYRYGFYLLPPVAFFIGILLSYTKSIKKIIILGFLFLQFLILIHRDSLSPNYPEGIPPHSQVSTELNSLSVWLQNNPAKGQILLSTLIRGDEIIFYGKIPFNQIIHEGTYNRWQEALNNPNLYVARIILRKETDFFNNPIEEMVQKNPHYFDAFSLDFDSEIYKVYDKKQ